MAVVEEIEKKKKKKTKTNENPINHKDVRTDAVTHETDDDIFFVCLFLSLPSPAILPQIANPPVISIPSLHWLNMGR